MPNTTSDAPPGVDGPPGVIDGRPGPDAPCADAMILAGGSDPAAQGWTVVQGALATLSFPDAQTTQLETQTSGVEGATLVLRRDGAYPPGGAFIIEVVMRVVSFKSADHEGYDMPAGIMGSFSPYPGTVAERQQQLYIDPDRVGWSDESQSAPFDSVDGAFHTYRLEVTAGGDATVLVDGQPVLQRSGFQRNGTFAVGDQTNRFFFESTTQIRAVRSICPP